MKNYYSKDGSVDYVSLSLGILIGMFIIIVIILIFGEITPHGILLP